jgi:selenocysteine lyase/cysteine desulfurase
MSFDFSSENLDREFPVRRAFAYFNHAAVAPLPRRVADAVLAHVASVRDRGAVDWRGWYALVDATRAKAAAFIGAGNHELAFLPNTSSGVNLVASSFPWQPGDNVVIDDMEFPSNALPWLQLEKRGIECRIAKNRGGRIGAEDVAARIDARTRVVAVSWVAFHNGWVFPIAEIGRLCRDRGILFFVDAIQGLGALPMDVTAASVDVLCADAHKWLYGQEGGALFYVREEARDRVPPLGVGWWNAKSGTFLDYELELHSSARRYEPGTLPTDHIAAISAAIDLLREMGGDNVRERILERVAGLAAGLAERGWRIASPEPLASGILAAIPPLPHSPGSMAKALEQRGVIVASREGAVRFSPHAGNDSGEVTRALGVIDEIPSA